MPLPVNRSQIDLRDLFELLRRHHLTLPFQLAVYAEREQPLADTIPSICRRDPGQPPCSARCLEQWADLVDLAMVSNRPQTHSCAQGMLGFAMPLPGSDRQPACLLGGGLREARPAPAAPSGAGPLAGHPPCATRLETHRLAEEIFRLLPQLFDRQLQKLSLAHISDRLAATREIAREVGRCTSDAEAAALVSEALVVLFDLPRVIFILQQPGRPPTVHTSMGLEPASLAVDEDRLADAIGPARTTPLPMPGQDLAGVPAGIGGHSALALPAAGAYRDGSASCGPRRRTASTRPGADRAAGRPPDRAACCICVRRPPCARSGTCRPAWST